MNSRFDYAILDAINNAIRTVKASPLVLGATASGGGGPVGGIVGYLTQSRVSYDPIEAETASTPASGMSIMDNLNHIRHRISSIEASGVVGSGSFLDLTDTPDSYTGSYGKAVIVNATEDGLEFGAVAGGINILSEGVPVVNGVTDIDFHGATVTAVGDTATVEVLPDAPIDDYNYYARRHGAWENLTYYTDTLYPTFSIMTNKSGATRVMGDVVIPSNVEDTAFTTTTTYADERVCGVVKASSIDNNGGGMVATNIGTMATVNCDNEAVALGDYLVTSTTAGLATSAGSTRVGGAFALAFSTKSAGSPGAISTILVNCNGSNADVPVTDAVNDFQVGDGAGAWIKKTLAQTVTILQTSLDGVYLKLSSMSAANAALLVGGGQTTLHKHRVLLPIAVYASISPMSAASVAPYAVLIDKDTTLIKLLYNVYVLNTNNSTNYWSIVLRRISDAQALCTLTTQAMAANTFEQKSVTSFSPSANVTTAHFGVYLRAVKVGSPGDLYVPGMQLEAEQ